MPYLLVAERPTGMVVLNSRGGTDWHGKVISGQISTLRSALILLLHNRYRVPGGEERAVEDLAWLIREHLGEEVEVLERDSSALSRRRAAEGLLRGGLAPEEVAEAVRRTDA